jgi:hypothetical protein
MTKSSWLEAPPAGVDRARPPTCAGIPSHQQWTNYRAGYGAEEIEGEKHLAVS